MPNDAPLTQDELRQLRDRLDDIDTGIIDLIAERLSVVQAIGDHKLRTGAPRLYAITSVSERLLNAVSAGPKSRGFPDAWRGRCWKH